jgi:uncharacterized membrane protein HdeD (DUF308 family)
MWQFYRLLWVGETRDEPRTALWLALLRGLLLVVLGCAVILDPPILALLVGVLLLWIGIALAASAIADWRATRSGGRRLRWL